jgi:hypothetical protein
MVNGEPACAASFFLDGNAPGMLPLVGDGLLPADIDGKQKPKTDTAIPIVGTQDDNSDYGATFDAMNIWDLNVKWRSTRIASLTLKAQLPTAPFDSIFPCAPTARDCLPQPGLTNRDQYLDILSYRQRPTFRRLSELQELRVAGHQPVGRGDAGRRRKALVTRSGGQVTGRTAFISRAHTRRATASTAGWAVSPWTSRATWVSGTASSTGPPSFPASATRAASAATRSGR